MLCSWCTGTPLTWASPPTWTGSEGAVGTGSLSLGVKTVHRGDSREPGVLLPFAPPRGRVSSPLKACQSRTTYTTPREADKSPSPFVTKSLLLWEDTPETPHAGKVGPIPIASAPASAQDVSAAPWSVGSPGWREQARMASRGVTSKRSHK